MLPRMRQMLHTTMFIWFTCYVKIQIFKKYFSWRVVKIHYSSKAALLTHQMKLQHDVLTRSERYKTPEEEEYKCKLRLRMEFTKSHAHDHLCETIKMVEEDNHGLKNKITLELVVKGFLWNFLLVDNRHTNLLNDIVHLQSNRERLTEMFSNFLAFNNQVLNNYKTTSCNDVDKCYDEIDSPVLLFNMH